MSSDSWKYEKEQALAVANTCSPIQISGGFFVT